MKASGLFFLRMRAYTARGGGGAPQVLLPVHERVQDADGRWITLNTLLCVWTGPEAIAFHAQHMEELVAGRGLELQLDRLRGHDGEWRAHVTAATLAPLAPSWQKNQPPQALPEEEIEN